MEKEESKEHRASRLIHAVTRDAALIATLFAQPPPTETGTPATTEGAVFSAQTMYLTMRINVLSQVQTLDLSLHSEITSKLLVSETRRGIPSL